MKTRLILLIALLGVFSKTWAVEADTNTRERKPIEFRMVEPYKVQLMHKESPHGLLFVKIYDGQKSLIVNERISKKNPFAKKYDLSQLEPGQYTIALYDRKGEIEQLEIDLQDKTTTKEVYTKVERVGKNKYKLLVNALNESDVVVSIYDNGALIYQDKHNDTKGFQKVYNLVNTVNGSNVEFKVTTEAGFSRMISVR